MDYNKIIIDMLNRICVLEEKVENLSKKTDENTNIKIGTNDIKNYIEQLKKDAKSNNEVCIVLVSNDIHKAMKLSSKMPSVCNAMRKSMNENDEILHETPSGKSSTLKIKYYL